MSGRGETCNRPRVPKPCEFMSTAMTEEYAKAEKTATSVVTWLYATNKTSDNVVTDFIWHIWRKVTITISMRIFFFNKVQIYNGQAQWLQPAPAPCFTSPRPAALCVASPLSMCPPCGRSHIREASLCLERSFGVPSYQRSITYNHFSSFFFLNNNISITFDNPQGDIYYSDTGCLPVM